MTLTCRLLFVFPVLVGAVGCAQGEVKTTPTESEAPPASCIARGMGLSPASVTLVVGDTTRFTFTPGGCSNPPQALRWFSADDRIAEVDSITGWVRGKAVGSIAITVVDAANRNVKTSASVQVVARP